MLRHVQPARFRTATRCRPPAPVLAAKNQRPRSPSLPPGSRMNRCTARARSGKRASKVDLCVSTRRRAVRLSATTSSDEIRFVRQPRPSATRPASRTFRSKTNNVAWTSGTTDLASTTSSVLDAGCHPGMSMEPRSPSIEKLTSGIASQSSSRSTRRTTSTRAAWSASSSRSAASPFQSTRRFTRAPRAAKISSRVLTVSRSAPPRSTRAIRDCETNASSEVDLAPGVSDPEGSRDAPNSNRVHDEQDPPGRLSAA